MKQLAIFLLVIASIQVNAQLNHSFQNWNGLMTSTSINDKWSWWNDSHLVPGSFWIARTGVSRHFDNFTFTGGIAHMWLSMSTEKFQRNEIRPWFQLTSSHRINEKWLFSQRFRYDARFQEDMIDENFDFHNRLRFMMGVKRYYLNPGPVKLFFNFSHEFLIRTGGVVETGTDQIRFWLMQGFNYKSTTLQVGYGNRTVTRSLPYTMNHTLTIWVSQKFSF